MWIRARKGCDRMIWRKKGNRVRKIKQIVFSRASYNRKLDIMVIV